MSSNKQKRCECCIQRKCICNGTDKATVRLRMKLVNHLFSQHGHDADDPYKPHQWCDEPLQHFIYDGFDYCINLSARRRIMNEFSFERPSERRIIALVRLRFEFHKAFTCPSHVAGLVTEMEFLCNNTSFESDLKLESSNSALKKKFNKNKHDNYDAYLRYCRENCKFYCTLSYCDTYGADGVPDSLADCYYYPFEESKDFYASEAAAGVYHYSGQASAY